MPLGQTQGIANNQLNNYIALKTKLCLRRLKSYYKSIDRIYISLFLSGLLFGLLFYFYSEDKYEENLFRILATNVRETAQSKVRTDSNAILLSTLQLVNELISSNRVAFRDKKIGTFKSDIVDPLTIDLMTGQGACGSYSMVMARILKDLNVDVRLVQMKVEGKFGGHIILEAKQANDNWAVFDPLYNLYFRKPDNSLASFSEVELNWNYYKSQVPSSYDMRYSYEGKRYTNWNKIPIIMPAIKKMLDWTVGKDRADSFSLRTFTLRKFHVLFLVTLVIQIIVLFYLFYRNKTNSSKKSLVGSKPDQKSKITMLKSTTGTRRLSVKS
ncbi:MAG: hypothetical protein ACTHMM_06310 [Agriterribacter sp.]